LSRGPSPIDSDLIDATRVLGADGARLPGSIAAIEKVRLGGVNQWVVIRGRSAANLCF
jgi:hypothetical protein